MKADPSRKPSVSAPSSDESGEFAPQDDAVIARATRWSVLALILVLSVVLGLMWYLNRRPAPRPAQVTALSAPVAPERPRTEIPRASFTDVTTTAGIGFSHCSGAEGEKLLPETMGGAAAFLDFDNDGDQDVLFINGAPWPWATNTSAARPGHALYRNDTPSGGRLTFVDVTTGSGLDVSFYGMGVACGDVDGDGLVDVFITAVGLNHLFKNLGGGRFKDVTAEAGVEGDSEGWSSAAAFADIDNDGDLDLFVANYVRWSREIDFRIGYSLDGKHRAYGPPMNFEGTFPSLYRNEGAVSGGVRFSDISQAAGVQIRNPSTRVPAAKSLGIAPADLNNDGWIDFIIANDTVQNFVFTNRHDGTFAEVGATLGIAFDIYGNTRGAMGIDTARHRNDDALGIGIGNFANEMTALYVSQGRSGIFSDEAIPEGIGPDSRLLLKFGLFFLDYDLDGWQDLLTANGHLEEDIARIQQSQSYRQPAQLFWNAGAHGGGFVAAGPEKAGTDLFKPIVGRGSAFADVDGDGDLDVLLLQAGGPPMMLRNDQQLGHHWIRFKLTGRKSNRDAIGAWVTVTAGGMTQWRQVMPTRSYLSQSELPVTFGLGTVTRIDQVEVLWPDGSRQKVERVKVDAMNEVDEVRPPQPGQG